MFTLFDTDSRCHRREFLRVGSLGLGGWSLSNLFAAQAAGAESLQNYMKDKSVVFVFMHGGPTQFETFDPKMTAPDTIRSVTGELATSVPGLTYGGSMPRLARLAHKIAVVRSYRPGDAGHNIKPIVHADTLNANMGSLYTRITGTNHPVTGIPKNIMLYPRSVDSSTRKENLGFGNFAATGNLGSSLAPFVPGSKGIMQEDMKLKISQNLLDDRRRLLAGFDRLKRNVDAFGEIEALDKFQEQAFNVILQGVAKAFDLSREDPKTIARYDTAPLVRPENIDKKWNNYNNYVDNAKSLGKLLLLARRLCESGCGFVTLTTNFVWDMHADKNNATIEEGMGYMGVPFDHAISTFLEDLEERGLSDKILLVACGEMGRTPKINKRGGRDHWGNLGPLLLAGGGLKMGQAVGRSSVNGGEPATEPVTIKNLVSTIMHTLLDMGQLRISRTVPADIVNALANSDPIRELVG